MKKFGISVFFSVDSPMDAVELMMERMGVSECDVKAALEMFMGEEEN